MPGTTSVSSSNHFYGLLSRYTYNPCDITTRASKAIDKASRNWILIDS